MLPRVEKEKEPWKDLLSPEERKGEVVHKLSENIFTRRGLKHLLSDACSTKNKRYKTSC